MPDRRCWQSCRVEAAGRVVQLESLNSDLVMRGFGIAVKRRGRSRVTYAEATAYRASVFSE